MDERIKKLRLRFLVYVVVVASIPIISIIIFWWLLQMFI